MESTEKPVGLNPALFPRVLQVVEHLHDSFGDKSLEYGCEEQRLDADEVLERLQRRINEARRDMKSETESNDD